MHRISTTSSLWFVATVVLLTVDCGRANNQNYYAPVAGLQSGNDTASSYAGGIVYSNGMLYLTGATYGTRFFNQVAVDAINPSQNDGGLPTKFPHFCFVASISTTQLASSLSSSSTSSSSTLANLVWGERQQYVIDSQHSQACTTLTTSESTSTTTSPRPELYVSGYYAEARLNAGIDVAGVMYDTTLSSSSAKPNDFSVNAGDAKNALYPMAVASVSNATTTALFIASMHSSTATSTWNASTTPQDDTIDPTTTLIGAVGSNYSMNVQKLVRSASTTSNPNVTWTTAWNQSYSTHDGPSVHLSSSMLFLSKTLDGNADQVDLIIVGGSTTGFGLAFGANALSSGPLDMDGFVTKLNAETGLLPLDGANVTLNTTEFQFGATYSTRIQSQPGANDYVMGLCHTPSPVDTSTSTTVSTVLYAVGTTDGTLAGTEAGGAFLIQLDVGTLQPIWTQQISGLNVEGIACAVTPDGQYVYMAGNHPYGTPLNVANAPPAARDRRRLEEIAPPTSTTDIFVAQFNTFNGTLRWLQTVGTAGGNERIAQGNGLVVDEQGNVFVYGNTRGSLFLDNTQGTNDIFVSFLLRDYVAPESNGNSNINGSNSSSGNSNYSFQKVNKAIVLIVAAVAIFALGTLYLACRKRRRGNSNYKPTHTTVFAEIPLTGGEDQSDTNINTTTNDELHDLHLSQAEPAIKVDNDSAVSHDTDYDHGVPSSSPDMPHDKSFV